MWKFAGFIFSLNTVKKHEDIWTQGDISQVKNVHIPSFRNTDTDYNLFLQVNIMYN